MADYIVTSGELTTVANAIREKNGTSSSLSWPDGFVSGISSGGGSGGETWNTVFDGNVTTEVKGGAPFANGKITGVESLTADTIKVTFNGVEYTCEKRNENDSYGAPHIDGDYDWSEYPFCITTGLTGPILITQTAGTYSLKIEEPQSGGGESDFSTAEITLNVSDSQTNAIEISIPTIVNRPDFVGASESIYAEPGETITKNIILYKGKVEGKILNYAILDPEPVVNVLGEASYDADGYFTITGDCTITIS